MDLFELASKPDFQKDVQRRTELLSKKEQLNKELEAIENELAEINKKYNQAASGRKKGGASVSRSRKNSGKVDKSDLNHPANWPRYTQEQVEAILKDPTKLAAYREHFGADPVLKNKPGRKPKSGE